MKSSIDKLRPLGGGAQDVLFCLFMLGPTEDGNVPSKCGRDELYNAGLVDRGEGWQWLTRAGVMLALGQGLDREKERRQRDGRLRK